MVYDIDMLRSFYSNFPKRVDAAREQVGRPLTLAEKILYAHLYEESDICPFRRGEDYVNFRPDRDAGCDRADGVASVHECRKIPIGRSCHRALRSPDPSEYGS